jgi:hypothetical protein
MMVERNQQCFGLLLLVGDLVGWQSCWTVFSVLMQFLHRTKTISPLFDLTCLVIYMEPRMACISYFPILFIFELHFEENIDFSYTNFVWWLLSICILQHTTWLGVNREGCRKKRESEGPHIKKTDHRWSTQTYWKF